jgi:hypothetical protein
VIKTIGMSNQGCFHTATKAKPQPKDKSLHLARQNPAGGIQLPAGRSTAYSAS